ncbi:hypothetical protein ACFVXE_20395 [Streptomyces sp. NPDC058231]|uniref:hypothetical protein n=1 Tax=Streptomyces sp. NPDC058231 TaxID=3346392 RepID=UPI0036E5D013
MGVLDPACQIEFGEKLAATLRAVEVVKLDRNRWPLLQETRRGRRGRRSALDEARGCRRVRCEAIGVDAS